MTPGEWAVGTLLIAAGLPHRPWLLRVTRVLARYVETEDGRQWSRKTGREIQGWNYSGHPAAAQVATLELVEDVLRGARSREVERLRGDMASLRGRAQRLAELADEYRRRGEGVEDDARRVEAEVAAAEARDVTAEAAELLKGSLGFETEKND